MPKTRDELKPIRGLAQAQRNYTLDGVELRAAEGQPDYIREFIGHAAVTGRSYPMYGGPEKGGWNETVTAGAFNRTLGRNPDVMFLVNHTGTGFARTTAGNLFLEEDSIGLATRAYLDTRVSMINDHVLLMEAGVLTEMSFAFRITAQRWLNADGDEVPWWDLSGIDRQIDAVDIHKGDVSIVNYGANPYTDAALREITDDDLVELLRGRPEVLARAMAPAGADPDPEIVQTDVSRVMHPDVAERMASAIERLKRGAAA
jgi:HK97 family phage prohead protease